MKQFGHTGERFPIIKKAVRVESNRKAMRFVCPLDRFRLLTLAVSANRKQKGST